MCLMKRKLETVSVEVSFISLMLANESQRLRVFFITDNHPLQIPFPTKGIRKFWNACIG